jgi:hypothetical protein
MENPFSAQGKTSPAVSLPFDQFQFRHVSLDHAATDPSGETSFHLLLRQA